MPSQDATVEKQPEVGTPENVANKNKTTIKKGEIKHEEYL
jgi:hypothetical protein